MVKLIQDLSVVGPVLFTIILIIAFFCAVWLIAALQRSKNPANGRFSPSDSWILKRNVSRLRHLRHS